MHLKVIILNNIDSQDETESLELCENRYHLRSKGKVADVYRTVLSQGETKPLVRVEKVLHDNVDRIFSKVGHNISASVGQDNLGYTSVDQQVGEYCEYKIINDPESKRHSKHVQGMAGLGVSNLCGNIQVLPENRTNVEIHNQNIGGITHQTKSCIIKSADSECTDLEKASSGLMRQLGTTQMPELYTEQGISRTTTFRGKVT